MKGLKCHTSTAGGVGAMFPRELVPLVRDLKACMRPESRRRKGGGGAQTLENTVMSETGLKFKVNVYYASFLVT